MNLGEFIDIVRWSKRMKQTELAKEIGVSTRVMGTILHNEYRITPNVLAKIGETLDIPLEVLFMWQGLEIMKNNKIVNNHDKATSNMGSK